MDKSGRRGLSADSGLLVTLGAAAAAVVGGLVYLEYIQRSAPVLAASLQVTPSLGAAPLQVTFAVISGTTAVQPVTYSWAFGDGTTAALGTAGSVVSHVYEAAGTFNASVVVKDARGESVTLMTTITAENSSGKTPTLIQGVVSPTSGTTSTGISTLGSLGSISGTGAGSFTPITNAAVEVTLNGSALKTITTDDNGEWDVSLGTLPAGVNAVTVTYAGDAQYDSSAFSQTVTIS